MRIGILGGGAFGTALARAFESRGHAITLWAYPPEEARALAESRESVRLPGFPIGPGVAPTADLAQAVRGQDIVVAVSPSHVLRKVLTDAARHLDADAVVVVASKGIEEETLATMDRVIEETLPAAAAKRAAFLSGPTFAREIALGLPTAIVAASRVAASAALVQRELSTERLRVYTSEDVVGIELCGALKNVCAIGAGISDGLGYGNNARAALITRGLAEIARLGTRLGAHPLTFAGLAGMGDLVLTCTGDLSRNRTVGLELAKGRTLEDILKTLGAVAEGVRTTRAARALSLRLGVEMPITEAIHAVLYEGMGPREAVVALMTRELKAERG